MLEFVNAVLQHFWLVPIIIIFLFIWMEERTRKAGYQDEIHGIEQVKITHEKPASCGTQCETTVKSIVVNSKNDNVLRLYYVDLPTVQKCLASFQLRKYYLYVSIAIVLAVVEYLLLKTSREVISAEQKRQIESTLSSLGLIFCLGFGFHLWFKRFIPIRTFCDEIKKLKKEK